MQNQIENLQAKKMEIIKNLRSGNDAQTELDELRQIDKDIKDLKRQIVIKEVNRKQSALRDIAKQLFECEKPTTDILCNDGTFHAVKVKKYPKLGALKYVRCKYEDNKITEIEVNGNRFRMYKSIYTYGQKTTFEDVKTFEEFLQLNSIMREDITIEEYNQLTLNCENINNEFKQACERFAHQKKELGLSRLDYYGLLNNNSVGSIYEYTTKIN